MGRFPRTRVTDAGMKKVSRRLQEAITDDIARPEVENDCFGTRPAGASDGVSPAGMAAAADAVIGYT